MSAATVAGVFLIVMPVAFKVAFGLLPTTTPGTPSHAGASLLLCSLEFVGRHEPTGWKLAETLTPIACPLLVTTRSVDAGPVAGPDEAARRARVGPLLLQRQRVAARGPAVAPGRAVLVAPPAPCGLGRIPQQLEGHRAQSTQAGRACRVLGPDGASPGGGGRVQTPGELPVQPGQKVQPTARTRKGLQMQAFFEAADAIRTHDLLHGKQCVGEGSTHKMPAQTHPSA
jgi:hypothetical protein